jgi:type IV secretory pathway VirB6-like protein
MIILEDIIHWFQNPVEDKDIFLGFQVFQMRRFLGIAQLLAGSAVLVDILGIEWFQRRGLGFVALPLRLIGKSPRLLNWSIKQLTLSLNWINLSYYFVKKTLKIDDDRMYRRRQAVRQFAAQVESDPWSLFYIALSFIGLEIFFAIQLSQRGLLVLTFMTVVNLLLLAPGFIALLCILISRSVIMSVERLSNANLFVLTDDRYKKWLAKIAFLIFLTSSVLTVLIG